ncbi:DUF2282 domain-containing protein [Bowmanella sp. Y26]|uniref:DUF2282 domain-containing protein n=1 Tax=Bowmanella yangjiangensis TaxID=2811230 RepID=A0ABS3CUJ3_9ALTE|nr:DUF2282 domain-containing protein [Bowmanella yangjiangensis]MBN7819811.1 DUF2282 domain-containing protein [Bowmanella yangjiangensis]MBT1063345.1 DUF2282 domain-containing protein [Bowmanella yangjiangensis]
MNNKLLVGAALTAVLAAGFTAPAQASGKEKCYGISKAGQNDCGNLAGTHSCAGQSTIDNDPGEWKLVAKGTCKDLGGMLKDEAKQKYKASQKNS